MSENSTLANAILADGVDFGYKKNAAQLTFDGRTYYLIEFFGYKLKEKRLVYVYSPYKELKGDRMKFERTNDTNPSSVTRKTSR